MKYLFALSLAFCFHIYYVNNSYAQTESNNSMLWEISGNGLTHPSYLFGTIHMMCPNDFVISETLKQKFAFATKVYLELDMDDPLQTSKLLQYSMMKDKKLSDIFPPADYARLNNFFKDTMGVPLNMLNTMKPFVILSVLEMKFMPCVQQESYELNFVKMCKAQHKEMLGLETVEEQLKVFDDMPDSVQVKMIMDAVNDYSNQKDEFEKMVKLYKDQNLDSLYQLIIRSPDVADVQESLLFHRNKNWIPKMEAAMKNESIFFAVGAGHLGGPKGLISLLKQQGYTLKPLRQENANTDQKAMGRKQPGHPMSAN